MIKNRFLTIQIKSYILLVCFLFSSAQAQDLVTSILNEDPFNTGNLFTESIEMISRSKRIFILSNTNQLLNKGDFVTMVLNEKDPVARAIVAKNNDGRTGIKILKIYSLKRWAKMEQGLEVGLIKGDDSKLFQKTKNQVTTEDAELAKEEDAINQEEDLYSTEFLDDSEFEDQGKRFIKPDNLVSTAWGPNSIQNTIDDSTNTGNQLSISWGYQFIDNLWIEGFYGYTLLDDFPATNVQTAVTDLAGKIKYTFQGPLYTYIMPYVGYHLRRANSPQAGDTEFVTTEQAELETALVQSLNQGQIIGGVTLLRRLVPGWFAKIEIDNVGYNLGVAIEF